MNKQILLVSGSLRVGSTNTAALHTAQKIAPNRIQAIFYTGMGQLPHFNPDDDLDAFRHAAAFPRTGGFRSGLPVGSADGLVELGLGALQCGHGRHLTCPGPRDVHL